MKPIDRPARTLTVLYFIGSYSPDLMGNAGHEQVIRAMRARGHDVEVLTQINEPGQPRYSKVEYSGVSVFRVNLGAPAGPFARAARKAAGQLLKYEHTLSLISAYRRQLSEHKYDLAHVEGVYPFGLVAAISGSRTPYVANVQGADVIELPENDYGYRRFRLPRRGVTLALDRAALIRVNSPFMVRYLVKERLAPERRVVMVPRVLEESAFPPQDISPELFRQQSREMLAAKYGLGLSRPVVMSLSRLHPFKGLEYLVDAIPVVLRGCRERGIEPPWFVLCGPSRGTEHYGDYKEFLRKRAEAEGVASHVVFTGQVPHPEVRRHLAGADIVASPSILEALHRVALEAAAVGTPTVVTETTGAASYMAPFGACLSIEPRSHQAIAEAVLRLLTEPDLYARVRESGLHVAATLKVDAVVPQLEAAWDRAASS